MASEDTSLMLQSREVKARHPDALVFFRVGDFYESFNDDAVEGSKLLDLTLTSPNNGGSKAPSPASRARAGDISVAWSLSDRQALVELLLRLRAIRPERAGRAA